MKTLCLLASLLVSVITKVTLISAQPVLFDFDNAPVYTSLPISQTVSGIKAHFAATGAGYSIQNANTMGFTPQGFAGLCIYPNSINLSDLLIRFDQPLTDFSLMYACQELGCDDAATMRVTAFMNGIMVGTNTKTATYPGTWPSDTLSCSFPQGFDSVVVHYDHRPPTCQDYGVIYLADNMWVTALSPNALSDATMLNEGLFIHQNASKYTISFSLSRTENITASVYDMTGRIVKCLFNGSLNTGAHRLNWDADEDALKSGVYILKLAGGQASQSRKLIVVR